MLSAGIAWQWWRPIGSRRLKLVAFIAATLTPLAAGHLELWPCLSVALAIFAGLFCFAASVLRLGFLADFLSRPILVGFLNGVAISIFLGQIGKVFGFPMESHGIIPSFLEFVRKVPDTHRPTLAVGMLAIAVMLVSKRLLPRWPGPLLAVALALLLLLKRSARPPDAVLGRVPGMKGFHDVTHHPDAGTTPGLLLYRFGAGIVFFNASYLKKRILELAAAQGGVKWVVIDGSTVNTIDSTGAEVVEAIARDLARQRTRLGLAGFRTETRTILDRAGALAAIGTDAVYPTLKAAMNAYLHQVT